MTSTAPASTRLRVSAFRAYRALFEQNEGFRTVLTATGKAVLTRSIGNSREADTVLTEREFCSRLMKLQDGKL